MVHTFKPQYSITSGTFFFQIAVPKKDNEVKLEVKETLNWSEPVLPVKHGPHKLQSLTVPRPADDWSLSSHILQTTAPLDISVLMRDPFQEFIWSSVPVYVFSLQVPQD